MKSELWVRERTGDYLETSYRVGKTLFSGKSPHQSVDVVESPFYGRMLLNDGLVMVSEKDEFVYHEMMAHVPLFTHPDPRDVLIIGGGDGGSAREVLRHGGIQRCVMVEIDEMVVKACREHIPQTGRVLEGEDKRLELIIGDGVLFAAKAPPHSFDVILVDSTDPLGPAVPLFGPNFYASVEKILRPGGIVVSQAESPWYNGDIQCSLMGILRDKFPVTLLYTFANLTYCNGPWAFSFASKGTHPLRDFNPRRVEDSALSLRYYNEGIHRGAFQLPTFIRENLGESLQEGP